MINDLSEMDKMCWFNALMTRESAALLGLHELRMPLLREDYDRFLQCELTANEMVLFEALPS